MKVILLKDHPKLGKKFDVKEVKPGYAKNLLLPKGMAMVANNQNMSSINRLKEENKARDEQQNTILSGLKDSLKKIKIEIVKKANKEGKLFASVTEAEVKKAIKSLKVNLGGLTEVCMDKHIKELGIHEVVLIFGDKKIPLKLDVKEG